MSSNKFISLYIIIENIEIFNKNNIQAYIIINFIQNYNKIYISLYFWVTYN